MEVPMYPINAKDGVRPQDVYVLNEDRGYSRRHDNWFRCQEVVEKVRAHVIDGEPFLAPRGLCQEIIVCDEWRGNTNPTMATDFVRIFCNPGYFMPKTQDEKIYLIAHEILHPTLGHNLRRDGRDQGLWNEACDHEINNMLDDLGYPGFVKDGCCDKKYRNWHAERIYADLLHDRKEREKEIQQAIASGDGPDGGGEGASVMDSGGFGQDKDSSDGDDNVKQNTPQEAKQDQEGDGQANEGGGNDPQGDQGGPKVAGTSSPTVGQVWDAVNQDGSSMDAGQLREAVENLRVESQIAKMGEITNGQPGRIGDSTSVRQACNPHLPWKAALRRFFSKTGSPTGTTWKKLNRRMMMHKIYVPGKKFEGISHLVCAYDFSYSCMERERNVFNAEIDRLRKVFGVAKLTILPFNTHVIEAQIKVLKPTDAMPTEWRVGGGTAFAPIFEWVKEQDGMPDGIIVFTDLGSNAYGTPPDGVPVLWASSDPVYEYDNGPTNRPPFGAIIEVTIT